MKEELNLNIQEIIQASSAKILRKGRQSLYIFGNKFLTDTRLMNNIKTSFAYIPFKGLVFDGHDFIFEALEKKADIIFLNSSYQKEFMQKLKEKKYLHPFWVLEVSDTLKAYQKIAADYFKKWKGIKIAITGSSGKTTTKEILKILLEQKYCLWATPKNLNNAIGLPYTMLNLKKVHELVILEMGAGLKGDLHNYADLVRPDLVLLSSISHAHSEFLGADLEDIAFQKRQILDFFKKKNKLFIYEKENCYKLLTENLSEKQIIISKLKERLFTLEKEYFLEGYDIIYQERKVYIPLYGEQYLKNLNLCLLVSHYLNIPTLKIQIGLERLALINKDRRFEKIQDPEKNFYIIQDFYNANPGSMDAGLSSIYKMLSTEENRSSFQQESFPKLKRIILVLADMLELHEKYREALHLNLKDKIKKISPDLLFTLGFYSKKMTDSLIQEKIISQERIFSFLEDEKKDFIKKLISLLKVGDFLYIKGSRFFKLEDLVLKIIPNSSLEKKDL